MTLTFQLVRYKVITLLCCAMLITPSYATQNITVLVPNFPPYTQQINGKLSGIGIEQADKVFAHAGLNVTYRFLPNYAKVLHEIKHNRGDAFLLASQNDERDKLAELSNPLVINKWCWYLHKNSTLSPEQATFKSTATISSHFNTNTHKWLNKNNYVVEAVTDISRLPELLLHKRIDAVFLAELVFEKAIKEKELPLSHFKKVVEVEKPFGIYISKKYLESSPDTLKSINKSIQATMAQQNPTEAQ